MQAPAGRNIVVVNDDPSQLLLATTILQKDGLEVFPYENAEDALVGIRELAPPDLVITDLNMPGTGGWNFCRLLRSPEFESCNRIPILIVSATYSGADTRRITADVGANKFLPAPYQPADLRNTVAYLLERFDRGRLIIEPTSLLQTTLHENSDYGDINDPLAKAWKQSKQAIMGRVEVLEEATVALVEGSLNDEMRRGAEREAHKLAGSVGTFGFPEGSRIARELEDTLRGNKSLGQTEILLLCDKTVALRRALDKSPEIVGSETTPDDDWPTLLVVDHDRGLVELLAAEAQALGMRPHVATDLSSAREVLRREDPDVVVAQCRNLGGAGSAARSRNSGSAGRWRRLR
ncbi:response regulator [candidate division KSB1 bacterium]|nr:response regulator [candidate division KSB1 bacterium]